MTLARRPSIFSEPAAVCLAMDRLVDDSVESGS